MLLETLPPNIDAESLTSIIDEDIHLASITEEDNMTQSQLTQSLQCVKCNQMYITQDTDPKWMSICRPCYEAISKTTNEETSFKCCYEDCQHDQHDQCSSCKGSYCLEHYNGHHYCEEVALQPDSGNNDEADANLKVPETIINEDDAFQGLFQERQNFLASFLKSLTMQTPGKYDLYSYLFYLI